MSGEFEDSLTIETWPRVKNGMLCGNSHGVKINHPNGAWETCDKHRNQHKNIKEALAKLKARLVRVEIVVHRVKLLTEYYPAAESNLKMFEIRKNDRDYQVGDRLTMERWCPSLDKSLGEYLERQIIYITDFMQKPGYVVLGLKEV